MGKKTWIILIFFLVVIIVIYFYTHNKEEKNKIVFSTEKMHNGVIKNIITATGTIQPVDTVAVGTQVSGTIKTVYVDFNSIVKKGQLIAEMDKSLLIAAVDQCKSVLQNANSQQTYQQQNIKRQQQLFDAGAISVADLETAQYQYDISLAGVNNAEAQLVTANRNLFYSNICSPVDGIVISRNVSEGQTVASSFSTPTLFIIARDLKKMQVMVAVDESDIGNVKEGQQVNFTVDAFPDDVFSGKVEEVRLHPKIVANVVTYSTMVTAPNDQMKLKPGMTANINIVVKEEENIPLISVRALSFNPDSSVVNKYKVIDFNQKVAAVKYGLGAKNNVVWVFKGNQLIKKNIVSGLTDDLNVQILSGLHSDDSVITGIERGKGKKKKNENTKSPFMPSRRPGQGGLLR